METVNNVPKLRFPEFSEHWRLGKLGDLINCLDAGVSVNSTDASARIDQKGILKTSCVTNGFFDALENKLVIEEHEILRLKEPVRRDTVIISRMNTPTLVGANSFIKQDYPNLYLPDRLWAAKINSEHQPSWVGILTSAPKLRAAFSARGTGTSGSMKNITKGDVLTVPISYPSKKEQQKIASFLTEVDNKIEQLTKKKQLLSDYKKGVMQQIFSQQIRFKQDDGSDFPDWEVKKLDELTKKISNNRNKDLINASVYSVTNNNGFVLQTEHFDKVVAGDDLSNYKIVKKNDFAYNPARINVGSIAHFHGDLGVISSLYVCFTTTEHLLDVFLLNILELEHTKYQINNLGEGGVRIYLWYDLFGLIKCKIPCIAEQTKIANFLTELDNKINHVDEQLAGTKQFKQGLLQQMFV